jgi:transcriptional antiterminator NusG
VTDEPNNATPTSSEEPAGSAAEGALADQPKGVPEVSVTPAADLPRQTEPNTPATADVGAPTGQANEPESAVSGAAMEKVEVPDSGVRAVEKIVAGEEQKGQGPAAPVVEPKAAAAAPRTRAKKGAAAPAIVETTPAEPKSDKLDWYILKVQSNREDSIREGLQRRVKIAGLDKYFGEVIVPIEMVTEFKGGKKRVVKRKLYPGYLVVQMEINEDTWFLVRETPGIGDFTGASGRPSPMLPHEIARIIARQEEKSEDAPKLKINFNSGDRVKINDGTFENFEGEVEAIDQQNGRVTVMINIFGRSTPVELEYWQIEAV